MSGLYTFHWPRPANQVFVTGTFDDWKKETELDKLPDGSGFEKTVKLPKGDHKYKFVVDGNWTTDFAKPTESDDAGIINNVLTISDIEEPKEDMSQAFISNVHPESTTVQLAGQVPKENDQAQSASTSSAAPESNTTTLAAGAPLTATPGADAVPGGFPQTPANEKLDPTPTKDEAKDFSVNPLPASETATNPVNLQPGEPVPKSEVGAQSVQSTVKLDETSYEQADASNLGTQAGSPVLPDVVTPMETRKAEGRGVLDLPGVTSSMIPESSLPIGSSKAQTDAAAVPEIVKDSQEKADAPAEASAIPAALEKKEEFEKELKQEVPTAPATAQGSSITDRISSTVANLASAAGITSAAGATPQASPEVPTIVKDSQAEAGASAEAAAISETVEQKKVMEAELKAEVQAVSPPTPAAAAQESANKTLTQDAPVVTNGVTEDNAASSSAAEPKTEIVDPVAAVPAPVKKSLADAEASAEAAGSGEAVENKNALENELKDQVQTSNAESLPTTKTDDGSTTPKEDEEVKNGSSATPVSPKKSTDGLKPDSASATDKKLKRKSFFGKLKEKFSSK